MLIPLKRAASGLLPRANTFLPNRVKVVITSDSAMTTSQTKNSDGIQRMSIWANFRKGFGRPAIIRASEISMRSPRTAVIMPSVAMKGGTRPSWISTPLRIPRAGACRQGDQDGGDNGHAMGHEYSNQDVAEPDHGADGEVDAG